MLKNLQSGQQIMGYHTEKISLRQIPTFVSKRESQTRTSGLQKISAELDLKVQVWTDDDSWTLQPLFYF